MRIRTFSSLPSFLIAISCAFGGAAPHAAEYPIRLHRPMEVGKEFQLVTEAEDTLRSTLTAGGRTLQQQRRSRRVELHSDVKVHEVDSKGNITRADYTVRKCLLKQDGQERLLFPSQTVITATAGQDRRSFLVDGREPDQETAMILMMAIPLSPSEVTSDDVFGTDTVQKVGNSWPVKTDALIVALEKQGLKVNKEDLEGRSYLERIVTVDGRECMEVSSRVFIRKPSVPLPPGAELKSAFASVRYAGKFPLDSTLPPVEEGSEMNTDVTAQVKPGGNAPAATFKLTGSVRINAKVVLPSK